jgi:hypothetical protein
MADESKVEIPDSAPWYAKTGMQVAVNFGVPTLILMMVIVFWFAREMGWAPNPVEDRLKAIEAGLQQNAGGVIRHDATTQEMVKAVQLQNDRWEQSEKRRQVWCVNRAKTDEERKACIMVEK